MTFLLRTCSLCALVILLRVVDARAQTPAPAADPIQCAKDIFTYTAPSGANGPTSRLAKVRPISRGQAGRVKPWLGGQAHGFKRCLGCGSVLFLQ